MWSCLSKTFNPEGRTEKQKSSSFEQVHWQGWKERSTRWSHFLSRSSRWVILWGTFRWWLSILWQPSHGSSSRITLQRRNWKGPQKLDEWRRRRWKLPQVLSPCLQQHVFGNVISSTTRRQLISIRSWSWINPVTAKRIAISRNMLPYRGNVSPPLVWSVSRVWTSRYLVAV